VIIADQIELSGLELRQRLPKRDHQLRPHDSSKPASREMPSATRVSSRPNGNSHVGLTVTVALSGSQNAALPPGPLHQEVWAFIGSQRRVFALKGVLPVIPTPLR
jgi:hypothetical protein